jgi:hypothetical protein
MNAFSISSYLMTNIYKTKILMTRQNMKREANYLNEISNYEHSYQN